MKKYLFCLLTVLFTFAVPLVGNCAESQDKVEEILVKTEFIEVQPLKSNRQSVNVFSEPSIRIANNVEGTIKMADILSQEYKLDDGRIIKEVGISINITPQIIDEGRILLKVNALYSMIKSFSKDGDPLFRISEPAGEVICKDGESAFIGAPITGTKSTILIKLTPTVMKK